MSMPKLLFNAAITVSGPPPRSELNAALILLVPDPRDVHPQVARERQDRRAPRLGLDVDDHDRVGPFAGLLTRVAERGRLLVGLARTGGCRSRSRGSWRRRRARAQCSTATRGIRPTSWSIVRFTTTTPAVARPAVMTSATTRARPEHREARRAARGATSAGSSGGGVGQHDVRRRWRSLDRRVERSRLRQLGPGSPWWSW